MKGKKNAPPRPSWSSDLETLRRLCSQPMPADSALSVEQQIRPGLWRKVYLPTPPQRFLLRAALANPPKELLPPEVIATRIDNRPLLPLNDQLNELMQEIHARACLGDPSAIYMLVNSARGIIEALLGICARTTKSLCGRKAATPTMESVANQNSRQHLRHPSNGSNRHIGLGRKVHQSFHAGNTPELRSMVEMRS